MKATLRAAASLQLKPVQHENLTRSVSLESRRKPESDQRRKVVTSQELLEQRCLHTRLFISFCEALRLPERHNMHITTHDTLHCETGQLCEGEDLCEPSYNGSQRR